MVLFLYVRVYVYLIYVEMFNCNKFVFFVEEFGFYW